MSREDTCAQRFAAALRALCTCLDDPSGDFGVTGRDRVLARLGQDVTWVTPGRADPRIARVLYNIMEGQSPREALVHTKLLEDP